MVKHRDPRGRPVWRCSIFRNETQRRASELIREATRLTYEYFASQLPLGWHFFDLPLTTEVAPSKVRAKRDAGHCFIIAGWRVLKRVPPGHGRPGHVVLVAPLEVT